MAKSTKKASTKTVAAIDRAIRRGELRTAAEMVKEAELSEADFDDLMSDRPDLREVYLAL